MFKFLADDQQDTDRLGVALAEALPAGSVVALIGPLGAGKTRLVQAVAAGLGVERESVTSPTFVLVNEYRGGRLPVFHFDTYRLKDEDEFLALGPEEYFEAGGIVFVEWADRVAQLLPVDRLEITLRVAGEVSREFEIRGTTAESEGIVGRVEDALR
jgi:tRNA threonylcarbamoyladenosine biosynthesis protein TsaE